MLKKTLIYKDFDGNDRKEDFYFNLTKAEITEMELSIDGGFGEMLQKIVDSKDGKRIIAIFKDLVIRSYGVKSPDGKRFIKNDEVRDEFVQSQAYSDIFMELATDADAASAFVKGIMPPDLVSQIDENGAPNLKALPNK